MKVYTCTDHDCHYPVGVASVVVARDVLEAQQLLDAALIADGLRPWKDKSYTLTELPLVDAKAVILDNGEY